MCKAVMTEYGLTIKIVIVLMSLIVTCNAQDIGKKEIIDDFVKSKITFVELGSVNCIPCKQMQPVMKAIEKKYGQQVNVIFYDVWQKEQKKYADEYKIRLIPTQVFLDENGIEFHRHEGFYPEEDIDKIMQSKGLKPKKN